MAKNIGQLTDKQIYDLFYSNFNNVSYENLEKYKKILDKAYEDAKKRKDYWNEQQRNNLI